jgi:hypothetical protein
VLGSRGHAVEPKAAVLLFPRAPLKPDLTVLAVGSDYREPFAAVLQPEAKGVEMEAAVLDSRASAVALKVVGSQGDERGWK